MPDNNPRTPITRQEAEALLALEKCNMQPGEPTKKFVREMCRTYRMVEALEEMTLTERQKEYLHGIAWRYRAQLKRYQFYTPAAWKPQGETKVTNQEAERKLEAWKKASGA